MSLKCLLKRTFRIRMLFPLTTSVKLKLNSLQIPSRGCKSSNLLSVVSSGEIGEAGCGKEKGGLKEILEFNSLESFSKQRDHTCAE